MSPLWLVADLSCVGGPSKLEKNVITLNRTGERPLSFDGKLIASGRSPQYFKTLLEHQRRNRWFECYVYETTGGKLVVNVLYRFTGRLFREVPMDLAEVVETVDDVLGFLDEINVDDYVTGYPPFDEYAEKQDHLLESATADYGFLLSDITDQLCSILTPEVVS